MFFLFFKIYIFTMSCFANQNKCFDDLQVSLDMMGHICCMIKQTALLFVEKGSLFMA